MGVVQGFSCDGPRCSRGKDGSRVQITWLGDSPPESAPDAFFRFINVQPIYEEPFRDQKEQPPVRQFCSAGCARDWLGKLVPPRSPREQSEIALANKEVESRKAAKKIEEASIRASEEKLDKAIEVTGDNP